MTIIDDGKGRGKSAAVSEEHRLATNAVTTSPQQHASGAHGKAFQVVSGIRAVTGAYGILALKNEGVDNIVVTYIRVGIDKVETAQALVQLYMGGVWVAGTTTDAPVNLNGRYAIEAGITSHYNAIPTGSLNIDTRWVRGPSEVTYNKEGSIVLPTNGIFSIKVTPETASVNVHARISFIVLSEDELLNV